MPKILRRLTLAVVAPLVVLASCLSGATAANAATGTCLATTLSGSELDMCRTAVSISSQTFAPLNGRGVVNLGREWCNNKRLYSVKTANTLMERKVGHAKMLGVFAGAENSFC